MKSKDKNKPFHHDNFVAGVGSDVKIRTEKGKLEEASIVRMGPNPGITVKMTESSEVVEVAIAAVVLAP